MITTTKTYYNNSSSKSNNNMMTTNNNNNTHSSTTITTGHQQTTVQTKAELHTTVPDRRSIAVDGSMAIDSSNKQMVPKQEIIPSRAID